MRHVPTARCSALVVLTALVAGCSGGPDPAAAPSPASTATAPAVPTAPPSDAPATPGTDTAPGTGSSATPQPGGGSEPAEPIDVPNTPVGDQARWVLEQLAVDAGPDAAVATERFAPAFLAQVPAEQVAATFDQLRGIGEVVPTGFEGNPTQASVTLSAEDQEFGLSVAVDANGQIETLVVQPRASVGELADWDAVEAELTAGGAEVSLLAARVENGVCTPVHEVQAQTPRPMASVSKLYVLGATARSVIDGDMAWSRQLTVDADVRSLPTGVLQDLPDGAVVSAQEAASALIAYSDNTAADLLLNAVGRDAVEDAVTAMGHAEPALLTPFPRTRELFRLGWGDTDNGAADRWADAGPDERRDLLGRLPGGELDIPFDALTRPRWQDGLDWFASADDVCAAQVALQELAADDAAAPVREILSQNPGITLDPQQWPYVGFKGGSLAGVLAGSWYAEDADGTGHVLVITLTAEDPAALAEQNLLFDVATEAFDLMAIAPS